MEHEKTQRLKRLTRVQKAMVCEEKKRNPAITQQALAQWALEQFNLKKAPTQATISNILAKKYTYNLKRKESSSTEDDDGSDNTDEDSIEVVRFSANRNEIEGIPIEDEPTTEEENVEKKMFRFKSEVSILQVEVWLLKYICKRKRFPSNHRLKKRARLYARRIAFPLEDPAIFTSTWVKRFKAKYGLIRKEEEEKFYLDLLIQ